MPNDEMDDAKMFASFGIYEGACDFVVWVGGKMDEHSVEYVGGWTRTFSAVALDYLSNFDLYEMYKAMDGKCPNISIYFRHPGISREFKGSIVPVRGDDGIRELQSVFANIPICTLYIIEEEGPISMVDDVGNMLEVNADQHAIVLYDKSFDNRNENNGEEATIDKENVDEATIREENGEKATEVEGNPVDDTFETDSEYAPLEEGSLSDADSDTPSWMFDDIEGSSEDNPPPKRRFGRGQNAATISVGRGQNITAVGVGRGQNVAAVGVGRGQNAAAVGVGRGQNVAAVGVGRGLNAAAVGTSQNTSSAFVVIGASTMGRRASFVRARKPTIEQVIQNNKQRKQARWKP